MSKEGIEIHFDEKRGHLELACEPDAFAQYREIARDQLKDFPEIHLHKVIEMSITDTIAIVAKRHKPNRKILNVIFILIVVIVLARAGIGASATIARIFT